jgi:hypothetical protein
MSVEELEKLIFQIDLMLSEEKMSVGAGSLFTTEESK